jgi:hypothetical protein
MEMLKTAQEEADADRKSDREGLKEMTKANQEQMLAKIEEKINAKIKTMQEKARL